MITAALVAIALFVLYLAIALLQRRIDRKDPSR